MQRTEYLHITTFVGFLVPGAFRRGEWEWLAETGWSRIVTPHFPLRGDPRLDLLEDYGGGKVKLGAFCVPKVVVKTVEMNEVTDNLGKWKHTCLRKLTAVNSSSVLGTQQITDKYQIGKYVNLP